MSEASSDHCDGRDVKEKRTLLASMDCRDLRNKSCGKKPTDDCKGEVKSVKGSSSACFPETSLSNTDFSKLLEGVVFVLSGFVNPERATLRSQALEMGAEYRPDWTSDCTMLVCAFPNTPKFRQVKSDGGTIVSKEWISECYNQKRIVDIEPYLMHVGKPWRNSSKQFDPKQDQSNVQHGEPVQQAGRLDEKFTGSKRRVGEFVHDVPSQFSPSKIKQWAINDLHKTISWLESQDEKPEESEIKNIAAEGIITCLQDAIDSLEKNHAVRQVSEQWKFVPHVVKELVELEEKSSEKQLVSKNVLRELAINCKEIYKEEFSHLDNIRRKQQKTGHGKKETRAAQIKPDDAGFDSDETIEMTEEEIDLAYRQFSES
ncbi:DNA-repair protein XRCC1 [Canna indica]|uniref:DNA-repair protein XRCC1 n=1 Tax=Canna indica TaxID=4628 RepID=A0AAQ3KQK2_9LILI|nr:DNA-repair protein XRCC1 [Canna indica]